MFKYYSMINLLRPILIWLDVLLEFKLMYQYFSYYYCVKLDLILVTE